MSSHDTPENKPLSFRYLYTAEVVKEAIFDQLKKNDGVAFDSGRRDSSIAHSSKRQGGAQVNLRALKCCIIGAGAAGLYMARILHKYGIPYEIFEASGRVGGRMYTKNFPDVDPNLYYDVGAMRYPKIPPMVTTFRLFQKLEIPLVDYFLEGVKCPVVYNDIVAPQDDTGSDRDPDIHLLSQRNGGVVPDWAVEATAQTILDYAMKTFKDELRKDFDTGFKLLMTVDQYSTREYLRTKVKYQGHRLDFHTIQWMETMITSSGLFDQAFSETVLDSLDFDYDPEGKVEWSCVDGGTRMVVDAMLKDIKQPELNTRVARIAVADKDRLDVDLVRSGNLETRTYDRVFNTTTLACARQMDLRGANLTSVQKDALRALHYDASSKVGIVFKTPWWITKCGIEGGGSASSDLPLRTCVYPCVYPSDSIHSPKDRPAVLLASYSWGQDAQRIGSLICPNSPTDEGPLKELILRDLAFLHSQSGITYEFLEEQYETHHAFDWYHDRYTSGAFALFGPGQYKSLYPSLVKPAGNGNLHFLGEAASAHHAWIAGALTSAARAAINMFLQLDMKELVDEVNTEFGPVPEMELIRKKEAGPRAADVQALSVGAEADVDWRGLYKWYISM